MITFVTAHHGYWRTTGHSGRVDRVGGGGCAIIAREMLDTTQSDTAAPPEERRGCLFALSQPPLMIFLAVIGCLLLMASLHDLLLL
ncbi:hypothetical protein AB0D57_10280 [Streptomyces sp. NPDC048275]